MATTSAVVVAVLFVGPPAAIWFYQRDSARIGVEISSPPTALVVPVASVADETEILATAWFRWGEPSELLSPGLNGRITAVHVVRGDLLHDGQPVLSVDGVARRYAHGDAPIAVPLGRGSKGPDVERLQDVLQRWGLLAGEIDGRYGVDVEQAVLRLQTDLGVSGGDGHFDPSLLIWGPEPIFEVDVVAVDVGKAAPGLGVPIAVAPVPLDSVEILALSGEAVALPFVGDWVVDFGSLSVTLVDGADVAGSDVSKLGASLASDTESYEVKVRPRAAMTFDVVPTGAVVAGDDGRVCVWVPDAGGGFRAVGIRPLGTAVGGVKIEADKVAEVLANPTEALTDHRCPIG